MAYDQSIELLREALALLNDLARFSVEGERARNSYGLASRIEAHLALRGDIPHPAITEARRRWLLSNFIRVEPDEAEFETAPDGYWVRGWIRIGHAATGDTNPRLQERYEEAVAALPLITREAFNASRLKGLTNSDIASDLGVSVSEVERLIAEALLSIALTL